MDYTSVQREISKRMKELEKTLNKRKARETIMKEYQKEYPDIYFSIGASSDTRKIISTVYRYVKENHVYTGDNINRLFESDKFIDEFIGEYTRDKLAKFDGIKFDFTDKIDEDAVEKFISLLEISNDVRFLFKCTDANGKDYFFRLNDRNIDFIRDLLLSGGSYEKFSTSLTGSDIDWLTDDLEMVSFEIIDIDQMPDDIKKRHIRRGGYFEWQLNSDQTDLERYQLYPITAESIPKTNCFVYALEQSGQIDPVKMSSIKYDFQDIPMVTTDAIKHICEKYEIGVTLVTVYPKERKYDHYGRDDMDIRIALFHEHYFIVDKLRFNVLYFKWRNDPRLKEYSEEQKKLFKKFVYDDAIFFKPEEIPLKDSIQIFRDLFNIKDALVPINKTLLTRSKHTPIAGVSPTDFRRYSSESEHIVSKFYASIPDLYQISGNTEAYIRQCVRGGRVFIKQNRLYIHSPIVDLDINSLYPYAMSKLYIQKGTCKKLPNMSFDSLAAALFTDGQITKTSKRYISQAFMQIFVESVGRVRAPAIIDNLQAHSAYFVDAITLLDLIKYNNITGYIIEGLYFDGDRDYSIKPFIERLYEQRKTKPEMKLVMNKMSGYTMRKPKSLKEEPIKNKDVLQYIVQNIDMLDSATGENAVVFKEWTNQYNMVNFGVSILSMARHIMNDLIYGAQDSGIDVYYSDTDSIFIKHSDLSALNYPIGDKLGQLSIDFEGGYTQASEAIFLSKKRYICKLDDDKYHFRFAGLSKNKITDPWGLFTSLLYKIL